VTCALQPYYTATGHAEGQILPKAYSLLLLRRQDCDSTCSSSSGTPSSRAAAVSWRHVSVASSTPFWCAAQPSRQLLFPPEHILLCLTGEIRKQWQASGHNNSRNQRGRRSAPSFARIRTGAPAHWGFLLSPQRPLHTPPTACHGSIRKCVALLTALTPVGAPHQFLPPTPPLAH
jgi:hypothetical protein